MSLTWKPGTAPTVEEKPRDPLADLAKEMRRNGDTWFDVDGWTEDAEALRRRLQALMVPVLRDGHSVVVEPGASHLDTGVTFKVSYASAMRSPKGW
jgi:hypothetical protein